MPIHEIIHHGWLVKSPHDYKDNFIWNIFRKKKWKRRYFLLTMVTHVKNNRSTNMSSSNPSLNSTKNLNNQLELSYYENEQMTRKIGTIDLERCEEVLSHLQSNSFEHVFAIKTFFKRDAPRTYFLVSESEHDMITWVNCLCKYLKMIHESPLNRYSNRSSAGLNVHHQIQPSSMSVFPSIASLSTTALDIRGLSRTPTLVRKPMSIDYADDYSLCSLPRNATLQRLNSFSRNPSQSPYLFQTASAAYNHLPQCPPPSDYHEFLPLLATPNNTLPKSRIQYQAEQKVSSDDKSFVYFTESVAQLLQLKNQNDNGNDLPTGPSYYDTPKKNYSRETEEMHFYQNRISEFYDVPANHSGGVYSKEQFEAGKHLDELERFTSLPEGDASSTYKGLYSFPCKIKNSDFTQ